MLSIIVPTHNRCNYAVNLIKTLEAQICSEILEYIIVLDNCSDNTLSSLTALQTKNSLTVLEIQELCVAAARNKGAEAASGDYLLFLDDDVLPQDGFLEEHVRFLRQNISKRYAFVGPYPVAPEMHLNYIGQRIKKWWLEVFEELGNHSHRSVYTDCLTGNLSLLKEDFFLVGGFDENLRNDGREDYEFGIRLHKSGLKIKYIKDALAYHYPNFDPKLLFRKAYSFGRADVYLVRKHPEYSFLLDMSKLRQLNYMQLTIVNIISYFGVEKFIVIVGRIISKNTNKLLDKPIFYYYSRIYSLIYFLGVISGIGGVKHLDSFFSYYYDPDSFPEN